MVLFSMISIQQDRTISNELLNRSFLSFEASDPIRRHENACLSPSSFTHQNEPKTPETPQSNGQRGTAYISNASVPLQNSKHSGLINQVIAFVKHIKLAKEFSCTTNT